MLRRFRVPRAGELADAVYSPDGSRVLVAAETTNEGAPFAAVYDARTGQQLGKDILDPSYSLLSWAEFSADGRALVTADQGGNAYLWRATPGPDGHYAETGVLNVPGGQPLIDARFDPDRRSPLIVTCGDDGTARVWNRNDGTQVGVVREPGQAPIFNAVLGPHGWLLTAGGDGTVRIWDWRTGQQLNGVLGRRSALRCGVQPEWQVRHDRERRRRRRHLLDRAGGPDEYGRVDRAPARPGTTDPRAGSGIPALIVGLCGAGRVKEGRSARLDSVDVIEELATRILTGSPSSNPSSGIRR